MIVTGSMDTSARIWIPEKTEYVRLLAGHYFDVDVRKNRNLEVRLCCGWNVLLLRVQSSRFLSIQ